MFCPYCHHEMEEGYIEQDIRHALRWVSRRCVPPKGLLPISKRESIKLSSLKAGGELTVYRCAPCGKFIIDENDIQA